MNQPLHIEPFYFHPTGLEGAYVVEPIVRGDERGWFFRTYAAEAFAAAGLNTDWVQMNHSFTQENGTIRGMHFQHPPYSEVKLVRCITGAVYDVMVDIRQGSPTFLQWFSIELSAANKKALYIPQGFAHGFQTLTTDCELVYMHSAAYQPAHEGGLLYDEEALGIKWPSSSCTLSERDMNHPPLTKTFLGIKL